MDLKDKKEDDSKKPVMLYDGHCRFCQRWTEKWQKITKDKIRYIPCQKEVMNYPRLEESRCSDSVILILSPEGSAMYGAEAVFKSLSLAGRYDFFWRWYKKSPSFARLSEWAYRWIARHRRLL